MLADDRARQPGAVGGPAEAVDAHVLGARHHRRPLARLGAGRRLDADAHAGDGEPVGGDLGGQLVDAPDEAGDEPGGGRGVHLPRRAELFEPAVRHHADAVGDRQRLLLVVGDEQRRHPQLQLQPADLLAQADADLGVERRQRLVEEQHRRLEHQRPGQGDALLLAA